MSLHQGKKIYKYITYDSLLVTSFTNKEGKESLERTVSAEIVASCFSSSNTMLQTNSMQQWHIAQKQEFGRATTTFNPIFFVQTLDI